MYTVSFVRYLNTFILDFLELSARRGEYTGIGLGLLFFFKRVGGGGNHWGFVVVDLLFDIGNYMEPRI